MSLRVSLSSYLVRLSRVPVGANAESGSKTIDLRDKKVYLPK